MRIRDILSKTRFFFAVRQRFRIRVTHNTHNDLQFGKEMKMLMVVDTSLQPLRINVSRKFMNLKPSNEFLEA